MYSCVRTVPGLHRWCHKLLKRFAYVVLAAMEGDQEVLGQYNRSIQRLQTCLQQRIKQMHGSHLSHHQQDLEILLAHTRQLQSMVACVPRCMAADILTRDMCQAGPGCNAGCSN